METYNASTLNCFAFRRGTDVRQGITLSLGNMVSGYPFALHGIPFHNSECAYIAGAFSLDNEPHRAIRRQLVDCTNGYFAKRYIRRPNEALMRPDWHEFNVQWMRYVVWNKCLGNADFAALLLSLPDNAVIIEDSTGQHSPTATFWGTRNDQLRQLWLGTRRELRRQGWSKSAIRRELDRRRLGEWSQVGTYVGDNVMGKILMECRTALATGTPPLIDHALLQAKNITLTP